MKHKTKKCNGTGKAKSFNGCGVDMVGYGKYGLCPKCFYKWANSTEEGKELKRKNTINKSLKPKKSNKKKAVKKTNRITSKSFYQNTAWRWFYKYVLVYHSKDGYCTCATCGTIKKVNDKLMHLGHLIKVFEGGANTNFSTAFDVRNVMPQCHQCNVHKGGNELKMLDAIEKYHGKGTYDTLRIKKNLPFKLDPLTLKEISDKYRLKFNDLIKTKGNPWKK